VASGAPRWIARRLAGVFVCMVESFLRSTHEMNWEARPAPIAPQGALILPRVVPARIVSIDLAAGVGLLDVRSRNSTSGSAGSKGQWPTSMMSDGWAWPMRTPMPKMGSQGGPNGLKARRCQRRAPARVLTFQRVDGDLAKQTGMVEQNQGQGCITGRFIERFMRQPFQR
jgi:hypothetical protein